MAAPSTEVQDAMFGATTRVVRRVDIYEEDGTTPWMLDAPVEDGSITVDQGRAERRMFELSLMNDNGALKHYPAGFWYDKIIKVYRGVEYDQGAVWETQLGEFMVDSIQSSSGSLLTRVSGRDYTKKLLLSKFGEATMFSQGQVLEEVIKNIALNGGIDKFIMPTTGKTLGTDYLFERGTDRNKAITDLATAYNYEVFFNQQGYMVMSQFQDPVTAPLSFTFKTGYKGNLASYAKSVNDARIYNHIAVTGERSDQPPLYAEARNTEPSSPTRIEAIGERTYEYTSTFFTDQQQLQDVANSFLKVHALESFELNMESLVVPWLDVGQIVRFMDPDPAPGDPTRYLLSNFSIPMKLGTMSPVGKRVTYVG